MASTIGYFSYDDEAFCECPACGWSGSMADTCQLAGSGLRRRLELPRYCSWGIPEEGREIGHGLLYPAGPHPTPEPTQYLYSTVPRKTITPAPCGADGTPPTLGPVVPPAGVRVASVAMDATSNTTS